MFTPETALLEKLWNNHCFPRCWCQGALSSPWAFQGERIKAIGSSFESSFLSIGDSSVFQNNKNRSGEKELLIIPVIWHCGLV